MSDMRRFSVHDLRGMVAEHCAGDEASAALTELVRRAAAAPELVDALCRLVGGNGHEGDLYSSAAHAAARAALAKAGAT